MHHSPSIIDQQFQSIHESLLQQATTARLLAKTQNEEEDDNHDSHVLWLNIQSGNPYNVKVFLTHI